MSYRFWLVQLGIFLAGLAAVLPNRDANGQDRPLNAFVTSIHFEKIPGSIPVPNTYSYCGGTYRTYYDGNGRCSVASVNFLGEKYGLAFGLGGKLDTGDVVAMLGGVFRAKCNDSFAVLDRIPDKDVPKGVKLPKWDSITVPLPGYAGFNLVSLNVEEVSVSKEMDVTASLLITVGIQQKPKRLGMPVKYTARVKSGDILLLRDKGHLVRAIVPADREMRVVGWLELSPEPIPEADLIRDKKAFVRPTPIEDKPK